MELVDLKKEHVRNIIIITIIYLLTHGIILFISGTWWDEKTWAFCSNDMMKSVALQLGRPSIYFVMKFIFGIPEILGRILILLDFYLITICLYYIYLQLALNSTQALLMTLLFNAFPANDIRVLRGVFPYSLGLLFFVMGFCSLVIFQKKYNYRNIKIRCLTLLLFFCSFTLNSSLVFYLLPATYVIYNIIKDKQFKKLFVFWDFVILPFIYFFVKNRFFPAYGLYENYNKITFQGIKRGLVDSISVCYDRLYDMVSLFFRYKDIVLFFCAVFFIFFFSYIIIKKINLKKNIDVESCKPSLVYKIIILFIGILTMYLGVLPYVVIGQFCYLTGAEGRSSVLIGIGAAIVIYALLLWIPIKYIRIFICSVIFLCGMLHFNYFYMLYQQDYYYQLDLSYEMKQNKDILDDKKNILYMSGDLSGLKLTAFYTLNSNAKDAFGDETHFLMNGLFDYNYLKESYGEYTLEDFVYGAEYEMSEYEIGRSDEVEAIIYYENQISMKECFILKFYELFNKNKFEKLLFSETNLKVYVKGMHDFEEISDSLGLR